MADEDKKSKEEETFAGLGGEPSEDEQPTPTETDDADEDELPELSDLVEYELRVTGKDGTVKPTKVYADPVTNKIVAYAARFPSKDPKAPSTDGVMYMRKKGPWVVKSDQEGPYKNEKQAVERANLYQTSLNQLLAEREAAKKSAEPKPVPPTETPKEEDAEDLQMEDNLETKVETAAPAPAKDMEYKFVDGFWSAYVAVYDGGKKIGEYSAFGGKVTGPNAEKLAKPVLERIKEEYFKGMKGK